MPTALYPYRPGRPGRGRPPHLSPLAQLIAGEIPTLPNAWRAFTLFPDRSALLVDRGWVVSTVQPAADGLYDIETC